MTDAISYTITSDQIAEIIPPFHAAKRVPYFRGKPGIAKTAFVHEASKTIAKRINLPVAVRELHLASMSEVDVRGYLIPDGDHAKFTKPEFWATVENNPNGILFLDEFSQATHEVQKAVAPLLLEGRIGDYKLPEGWSVVLAGNTLDDNSGANTILAHVVNRVTMFDVKSMDVNTWVSWATAQGMPFELLAFANVRPAIVFNVEIPGEPDAAYCTPRSLHLLGEVANQWPGGLRAMVESTAGMATISGTIGKGPGSELSNLVRMAINLPSYEDVLGNASGTLVPAKPDAQYAMVMMLAVRAEAPDIDKIMEYLVRFPTNFALTGVISLVRRNNMFAQSKNMMQWIMANKDSLSKYHRFITEAL